jgi:uncharacterized membrane protein
MVLVGFLVSVIIVLCFFYFVLFPEILAWILCDLGLFICLHCISMFIISSVHLFVKIPYLCVYKPHFFDKNLPSKIGVRLVHGIILCPFDDWARDASIVCCETLSTDR